METETLRAIIAFRGPDNRLSYSITHRWALVTEPSVNRVFRFTTDASGRLTAQPVEQVLRYYSPNPLPHVRDWNPKGYNPRNDIDPNTLLVKPTDIITLN